MQPADTRTGPRVGRRGLALAGVATALGAAFGRPERAQAAAGGPLLLGRSNTAQTRSTLLSMVATSTGLRVDQRGTGIGLVVSATRHTAALATTAVRTRWGLHAQNLATTTGTGGAVRAEGRMNTGLLADTSPTTNDVPAVIAIGGNGTGVAQVATGESYFDGDALALRSWVGVRGPDGTRLEYAHVVSGEGPQHCAHGTATLGAGGTLLVTLPAAFLAACDTATLTVTATPLAAPMPNLHVTHHQAADAAAGVFDGFTLAGGASSGSVAWVAWARRATVGLPGGPAATAGAGSGTAPGTSGARPAPAQARDGGARVPAVPALASRRGRRTLVLPRR